MKSELNAIIVSYKMTKYLNKQIKQRSKFSNKEKTMIIVNLELSFRIFEIEFTQNSISTSFMD